MTVVHSGGAGCELHILLNFHSMKENERRVVQSVGVPGNVRRSSAPDDQ